MPDGAVSWQCYIQPPRQAEQKDSSGTEMAGPALCPAVCTGMSPGEAGSCWGVPHQVLSPLCTSENNLHLAHRQVSVPLPGLLHPQAPETSLG